MQWCPTWKLTFLFCACSLSSPPVCCLKCQEERNARAKATACGGPPSFGKLLSILYSASCLYLPPFCYAGPRRKKPTDNYHLFKCGNHKQGLWWVQPPAFSPPQPFSHNLRSLLLLVVVGDKGRYIALDGSVWVRSTFFQYEGEKWVSYVCLDGYVAWISRSLGFLSSCYLAINPTCPGIESERIKR